MPWYLRAGLVALVLLGTFVQIAAVNPPEEVNPPEGRILDTLLVLVVWVLGAWGAWAIASNAFGWPPVPVDAAFGLNFLFYVGAGRLRLLRGALR